MNKIIPVITLVFLTLLFVAWFVWGHTGSSSKIARPDVTSAPVDPQATALENARASVRIPFKLTEANNISIPVVVNGTDSLELMFHTAVESIYVTSDAVKRMKSLVMSDSVEIKSWGGSAEAGVSIDNRLEIGSLEWKAQTIFVDEYSGPGTDGKFGPNLFADKILEINFDRRELVIHSDLPASVQSENSIYHRMDYSSNQGSMYLVGELKIGESTLRNPFMIHSGFGGTALLDDAFVAEHQLADKLETISQRELKDSFGNIIKTKKVKLSSLHFGPFHFSEVPIEIFDGAIGLQKVSVLGGELLKRFNMIIDSPKHQLYLSPSSLSGAEFPG